VFLGDLTPKPKDTPAFIQFLKPYTATKIFIAGNHDNNLQLFNHVEEVSEFRIGNNTVKTINFIDHTQLLLRNPTEIFSRPYDIYLSHYGIFHPLLPTRLWKDPFDDYVNRYSDLGEAFNSGPREVSKSEWGRAHFMAFGQSEGRQLYDPTRDKGFNNMYGVPLEYLTSVFYKLFALKDRIFISGDCGAGVIESRDYIFEVVDRKLLLCTGMGSGAGGDNALYMDATSMRFLFFDANGDILREEIVYDLN